jgi:hypothetical protein
LLGTTTVLAAAAPKPQPPTTEAIEAEIEIFRAADCTSTLPYKVWLKPHYCLNITGDKGIKVLDYPLGLPYDARKLQKNAFCGQDNDGAEC